MTYVDTRSVISSPGSASGRPHSASQAGTMTTLSEPAVALASRSQKRTPKPSALTILGTSGPTGYGLSTELGPKASAGLTASLVSSLQTRVSGSILFGLTWKLDLTPSHRPIYRLRASPRARTEDNDFTGWSTPTTPSGGQTWPQGTSATGRRPDGSKATVNLEQVAFLAAWATPTVHDYRTPNLASFASRGGGKKGEQLNNQVIHQGPALIGSSAEIAAFARLNPAHPRWLLRLPSEWDSCGVTAMRSISRRRRNSSPRTERAWAYLMKLAALAA